MQYISVVHCAVPETVSGKVGQQKILVGDLDPIGVFFTLIDIVSGDRRHQIEQIAGFYAFFAFLKIRNRVVLTVPKFYAGICQYQRSARFRIFCRRRKERRRNASHDHQNCQQDADHACPHMPCFFCLHKKTPLIAGTLHAVCSAFFRANFVRRFLRFFAPWQQHRQKRYTYHIFYGNFHQLRRFQLFNCFHNQKNILAQITEIALIQLYYTDYP